MSRALTWPHVTEMAVQTAASADGEKIGVAEEFTRVKAECS